MEIEIWKDIAGYEGLYQVSDLGRVKGLARKVKHKKYSYSANEKILSTFKSSTGYYIVNLSKNGRSKQKLIHRLISIAFIKKVRGKHFINHINGIKTDNRLENLEWVTIRENTIHAYQNNLINVSFGDSHYSTKIKNEDVEVIRKSNLSRKDLADKYKVSGSRISVVINRKGRFAKI